MNDAALLAELEEARAVGDLGPVDPADHIAHARALASQLDPPRRFLDLGSGAGLPGLVLALEWPAAQGTLLDGSTARIRRLAARVERLGLADRIVARAGRAEEMARRAEEREHYDVACARSFGGAAVTAECGAPFVVLGGLLVVSEPPTPGPERWDAARLAELGLVRAPRIAGGWAGFEKVRSTPDRWPRRVGIPTKRPLW